MLTLKIPRCTLIASALAPALLLGACGTTNRGLDSVHQPVVTRTDYVFDVSSAGSHLAPGEPQRLAGWMASLRLGYGDRVSVDDPTGSGNGVRDDVQTQLGRYGLFVAENAPPTSAPIAPGMVRVVVSRMKATVPGCPDFSRVSGIEFDSNTSSNQGCAMNSNFAAMVANPADLVRGKPGADAADTASSTKPIEVFRKAAPGKTGS
jgi:pilus assembly protein CpaD